MRVAYIWAQSIEYMNTKQNIKVIKFVLEWVSIECRTTKTKTSYLLIRLVASPSKELRSALSASSDRVHVFG